MPARKTTRKTAKKGGTLDADLTSIAVPFGLLLAKQSLEKLSGTKVKAKKTKATTTKRVRRVAVGGSNANAANAVNVSGVNTMAHKTGANVGGKSVKKGRGRPRSKVGGNAANAVNATNAVVNATNSGNVSGVNTMAPKTGANVGGRRRKSKKGGANNTLKRQEPNIPTINILSPPQKRSKVQGQQDQVQGQVKPQGQVKVANGAVGGKSAKRGRGRPRKN